MITIVIWNQFEYGLKYILLGGDYSHLDQVFIGSTENQELQNQLLAITENVEMFERFPVEEIHEHEPGSVIVIEAGFYP